MDEKALGHRLQLARKRAGLTQQELCQKAGLSYSTLAKIERGAIKSPSVFTVAAIARATNSAVEDLLGSVTHAAGAPAPPAKKRSKAGVTFVYFDVNGTLARFYQRAFTQIAQDANLPLEIVETLFLHYDGAACRGNMTNEQVEKIFANEMGLGDFSWEKYYMENIQATPGIAELLTWVSENYEIGLLTNNWLGYTEALIKRQIIPDVHYTAIVESAKVGAAKPEAKIFEIAAERAGVPANEVLLVDDISAYLSAAQRAGWQTLHFDEPNPDASIAKIRQTLEF